jgi:hypothetical protein
MPKLFVHDMEHKYNSMYVMYVHVDAYVCINRIYVRIYGHV